MTKSACHTLFLAIIFVSPGLLAAACGLLSSESNGDTLPGTLVFSARDDGGKHQIFTMCPDGSGLKQLTFSDFEYGPGEDGVGFNGYTPSWSPDGKRIIFSSFYKSTSIGPSLWVMNSDGANLRPLHDPEPANIHSPPLPGNNPRWSPDETKIAFDLCVNCQISTNHAIFVFDLETEELTRLTEEPPGHSSMYPAWSPDGTRIAFTANRDYVDADTLRFRRDLYVIDVDGSNQNRVTNTGYVGKPVWQPNGNSIAYRSSQTLPGLYGVDVEAGNIYKIKEDLTSRIQLQPHAWSTDGSQILATAWELDPPRNHTLYLFDLNDNSLQEIYSQSSPNANPAFQGADWYVPVEN